MLREPLSQNPILSPFSKISPPSSLPPCAKLISQVGRGSVEISFSSMAEFGFRVYSCYNCRNNVSLHDDIVSKTFQASNGRGFLFSHAMNIVLGPKVDKQLISGLHSVADVYCCDCRAVLGWKYERAYVPAQKYKEGKFVLEKVKIIKENW